MELIKKKCYFLFLLFISFTCVDFAAQSVKNIESLEREIEFHFKKFTPEYNKFASIINFNSDVNKITKNQIRKEIRFYESIKNTKLINEPTEIIFILCHNLLIHSPICGKDLLNLLTKPTSKIDVIGNLYVEYIFMGEYGEQIALECLQSTNISWQKTWAHYLSENGSYDSSIPVIKKVISNTKDTIIQGLLINSLMYISGSQSNEFIKGIIDTTKSDYIQSIAIFAYAELIGFEGIHEIEKIETVGFKSQVEKKESLFWLKKETSLSNKFGNEVTNNVSSIEMYKTLKTSYTEWLENQGLLIEEFVKNPKRISAEKKNELLNKLIEVKGFGLEVVKGTLFLSLEKSDIEKLFELRQLNYYSPNGYTKSNMKTISLLIRYLKRI